MKSASRATCLHRCCFSSPSNVTMCRPTVQDHADAQVLERLQQRLQQQLNLNCSPAGPLDHLAHAASRGSGPRVFCGHVPPECSEELVKAHFSQWGHVLDVYFPKRKDTFRRRPFCFVTFARLEDTQCAIAESPMNICGIPIKQLNLVEDRADYYKHRHNAAQSALVQALQTLALLGNEPGAPGPPAPNPMPVQAPAVDLNNLAALLSLENASVSQLQAVRSQAYTMPQAGPMNAYEGGTARYAPSPLPFANLPGFSQTGTGLATPATAPSYMPAPMPQTAFSPASAAALAAALAAPTECCLSTDWPLSAGASSPFSTLDAAQHASAASSPPRGELAQPAAMRRRASGGSASSGSASPDLDAAASNRLAMWQLQNELLAGEGSTAPACQWGATAALAAPTSVN